MDSRWLYDILKDGTICDNQQYQISDRVLYNHRLPAPVPLSKRSSGQTWVVQHWDDRIWSFLTNVNRLIDDLQEGDKQLIYINADNYEHNTNDLFVSVSGSNANNFLLRTGNLIGFVKQGEYSIKISSRFGENFLKFIIADADGFLELEKKGGTGDKEDGYEWLLIYLWQIKLKKAFRLGLPKSYVAQNQRLNKVRGNVDVIDYYQPQGDGKYQCNFREHSYDNPAVSLISETFRRLRNHSFLQESHMIGNTFMQASKGKRVPLSRLYEVPHFTNPYYSAYNEVIDFSKLILQNRLKDFGDDSDTSAFLFDVSMLFEYYIKKLLMRNGFRVDRKDQNQLRIPTGGSKKSKHKLEPDIVIQESGGTHIFDVKYKYFNFKEGVRREDLFQLHTYLGQYIHHYDVKSCGFIFPISESTWANYKLDQSEVVLQDKVEFAGKTLPFYIFFLKIPDEKDGKTFKEKMLDSAEDLVHLMKTKLSK